MPYRPRTPCRHPGCGKLVEYGQKYCAEHKRSILSTHVQQASAVTTAHWQKASKVYLREHPLCEECMRNGKYVQAEVVDHVIPHRGDQKLFWDSGNWQSLCKRCHDKKTGRIDGRPTYRY